MPKEKHSALTNSLAAYDNQVVFDDKPLPLKPCNYGIFGRKGSGKTNLFLNLISRKESPWYKLFNLVFLISPTANRDEKLKDLLEDIGEDQYYQTLSNETLTDIIAKIDTHTEEFKAKRKNKGKKPAYLIVYDDVIHDLVRKKDTRLICMLSTQNRHRHITNVYLLQKYNTYLPCVVRSNLDCISYYRTDNRGELEAFVKEQNQDEEALTEMYKFATSEPYSFLHINMYNPKARFYKRFDEIAYRPKKDEDE
jgi:hypothetical protein